MQYTKYRLSLQNKTHFITLTLFTALAVILIVRVFFGFDWSDEGYYSATTYRLLLNDPMFVTSWDIHQFSAPLTLPLMKLYTAINGSMDGWILFDRIVYAAIKLLSVYALVIALRGRINELIAFISAAFLILSDSIYALNYNSMMVIDITFCIAILISLNDSNKLFRIKHLAAGIMFALAVQSYPAALISLPVFVAWLVYDSRRNVRNVWKCVGLYVAGGIIIITAFLVFLIYNSSVSEMLQNLQHLFADPEHKNDVFSLGQYMKDILNYKWERWFVVLLAAGAATHVIKDKEKQKTAQSAVLIITLLILFGFCLPLVLPIRNASPDYMVYFCFSLTFPLFMIMKPRMHFSVWIYLVGVLLSLGVDYASNNPVSFTTYPYLFATMATIIYIASQWNDMIGKKEALRYTVVLSLMVCIVVLTARHMSYIYRPEIYAGKTLAMLDKRLKGGPAKGLFTTEEQAKKYEEVTSAVEEYMPQEGNVLFIKLFPYGYLMTKASPATPRLWRTNLDYEGFDEYYRINPDKTPDAIFILNENFGVTNEDIVCGDYFNSYIKESTKETLALDCGKILLFNIER